MRYYTMELAKRDFEIGYLRSWRIERAPIGEDGWRVDLGEGNARGYLCDARRRQPRLFRSLDSAVAALEQVGFEVNALQQ